MYRVDIPNILNVKSSKIISLFPPGVITSLLFQDVLTDLNAEGDQLPVDPPREDWTGHKGMIQAAVYIFDKLRTDNILEKAFNHAPERGTKEFGLVLVGHSLGAGTASILAILMKQIYADLICFSYSPPGGLLRY